MCLQQPQSFVVRIFFATMPIYLRGDMQVCWKFVRLGISCIFTSGIRILYCYSGHIKVLKRLRMTGKEGYVKFLSCP